MNRVNIILLFCLLPFLSLGQGNFETGLSVSGGWVLPQDEYNPRTALKNGFSSGGQVYFSYRLWKPFSIVGGLGYGYKEMQEFKEYYSNSDGGSPYGGGSWVVDSSWEKFPQHYLMIPVKLRISSKKGLFVQSGIETSWLLNYEIVNEKPEYSWSVGFGNKKHKLFWTLEYVRAFKQQGFAEKNNGEYRGSGYRSRELRLSLSYPLFVSKQTI